MAEKENVSDVVPRIDHRSSIGHAATNLTAASNFPMPENYLGELHAC
jgi:hypothetical protein